MWRRAASWIGPKKNGDCGALAADTPMQLRISTTKCPRCPAGAAFGLGISECFSVEQSQVVPFTVNVAWDRQLATASCRLVGRYATAHGQAVKIRYCAPCIGLLAAWFISIYTSFCRVPMSQWVQLFQKRAQTLRAMKNCTVCTPEVKISNTGAWPNAKFGACDISTDFSKTHQCTAGLYGIIERGKTHLAVLWRTCYGLEFGSWEHLCLP